ncbi:hypothetical protein HAX54_003611, partial [Datura stramonium]|nr:hypothetical protein [Datura stramonium]
HAVIALTPPTAWDPTVSCSISLPDGGSFHPSLTLGFFLFEVGELYDGKLSPAVRRGLTDATGISGIWKGAERSGKLLHFRHERGLHDLWVAEVPFIPPLKIRYLYDLILRVSAPYFFDLPFS